MKPDSIILKILAVAKAVNGHASQFEAEPATMPPMTDTPPIQAESVTGMPGLNESGLDAGKTLQGRNALDSLLGG